MPIDWHLQGREVYALRPTRPDVSLDLDDATRLALSKLVREFAKVPEPERYGAIEASAEGYLAAHREAGGRVATRVLTYSPRSDPGAVS